MKKFLLFLSLIVLCSCKKEVKTAITEESTFDYKAYLLRNNDDYVPTLKFSPNSSIEEISTIIDNYTQQDCFDSFQFNYELGDIEIQSLAAEYCHNPPPGTNPTRLLFEINDENKLWFNYQIIDFNEVKDKTETFLNEIERDHKRFIIRYQINKNSNAKVTEKILHDIIQAYLEFAKILFQKENKKSIDQATEFEIDEFRVKHQMLFLFDVVDWFTPSYLPPPPPEVEHTDEIE